MIKNFKNKPKHKLQVGKNERCILIKLEQVLLTVKSILNIDWNILTEVTELITQSKSGILEGRNTTMNEVEECLKYKKIGKAQEIDEIVQELIKFMGVEEREKTFWKYWTCVCRSGIR